MILEKKTTLKKLKGGMVLNGKLTRQWLSKDDTSSTTESQEDIFKIEKINVNEGRCITVMYVPNTFINTTMPQKKYGKERVIMKTTSVLVDMLVKMDIEMYKQKLVSALFY